MSGHSVSRRYLPAAAVAIGVVALAAAATISAVRSVERRDQARRAISDATFVQQHAALMLTEEAAAVRAYLMRADPRFARRHAEARAEWGRDRATLLTVPGLRAFVDAGDALDRFFAEQVARIRRGDLFEAFNKTAAGIVAFDTFRREQIAATEHLRTVITADRAASDAALRRAILTLGAMGSILLLGGALAASLALRARTNALLARTDPLTKLPNRRGFEERLAQVLARRRPLPRIAVLYLDLDGFKAINDGLGHEAGDEVLVAFAERLRAVLRPHDVVARVGGDEFAAILDRLDEEDADLLAHRVGAALEEPLETPYGPRAVRASIGIALLPDDGTDPSTLLRLADEEMYRMKRARQAVAG